MAKLKNPLLSLKAQGGLSRALSFLKRRKQNIVESMPIPENAKTPAQLSWRHMFNKCVDLWHTLSAAEKQEWESLARSRHMTGYAWYISQCLRPNPGIYLPLQGGTMSGDIDMAKHRILKLPAPTDPQEAARLADIGAATFLGLTDTPGSYVGDGGKHVRVNLAENALQFVRNTFLALPDTPAAYAGQALKFVRVNAATNALEFTTAVGGYTESAKAFHNTNQSIADITYTTLAFNDEVWDTDSIHDLVSNNSRLTCKTAGKYIAGAFINMPVNATGVRLLKIVKNGTTDRSIIRSNAVVGREHSLALPVLVTLAVNDYLTAVVRQSSGGVLDVIGGGGNNGFWMARVGT